MRNGIRRGLFAAATLTAAAAFGMDTPLLAQVAVAPAPAAVGAALDLSAQPGSRLWVEGGSTVRGYSCEAGIFAATLRSTTGARPVVGELQAAVSDVVVSVPVAALDCGNGKMNEHMLKALKSDAHDEIRFRVRSHAVSVDGSGVAAVEMQGDLTMAGETRPVTIAGTAAVEPDGTLRVAGTHELNMSEWGIKPPTLMLGTLKVHDGVSVKFDLLLDR